MPTTKESDKMLHKTNVAECDTLESNKDPECNDVNGKLKRKVLVLDLDETLIHSRCDRPFRLKTPRTYKTNEIENPPDFVLTVSLYASYSST